MAVTDFLERGRLINPDAVCAIMGDKQYTYDRMAKLMNRVANGLLSLGYGLGRNAAVLSDNDPDGYACSLGVMRSAMTYIPMDSRNSAGDNERILDWGDAEVLFYGRRFHEQVETIRPRLSKLKHLICIDEAAGDAPGLLDWAGSFRRRRRTWKYRLTPFPGCRRAPGLQAISKWP